MNAIFEKLFDANPRPMWVFDTKTFAFLLVNAAACRRYGWSRDEFLTMTIRDIRPPEELARLDHVMAGPRAEGTTIVNAGRHRTKAGVVMDVELEISCVEYEGRQVSLVVVTDVTGLREAEREAELVTLETQRRLEYLMSATSAILYSAKLVGHLGTTFISPNVREVLGHDPSAFMEKTSFWIHQVHPEDRPEIDVARSKLLDSGAYSLEYRFRHRDGAYRWIHDEARVVRDQAGTPTELVGYMIEITARKHAEESLRRSEANFRTLIERSPTATVVHRDGILRYANPAAVSVLGYDRADELVGRPMLEFAHADDRAAVGAQMERTVRDGTAAHSESRMVRRDGSLVVLEGEGIRLEFDGQPSNVVLGRDVTERREMFARMAVADRMLSVGTLAAGVAHEINNPLSYVVSNLALLADELPGLLSGESRLQRTELEMLLADAREGASRVSAIVRDLRALSRSDGETSGAVDVVAVLASSIKLAHNELRHRARVVQTFDEPLPFVAANASRLGQVFLNLLVNAAHAIEEGHVEDNEIRVRAQASGAHVIVEVEDTGVGIAPGLLGRIFDPFFTTKPIGLGVGLGLSISHEIVRSIGGSISVTSTQGQGSTFRVALPVATAVATADPPEAVTPASVPAPRVLMIDDEVAVGRSTRMLLSPAYDIVLATRAKEGLARIAAGERFDAIICDLMMPEMSGIEFYQRLSETAPEYVRRVVFLTGGAFTQQARDFLARVAQPTVEKPFAEDDLRRAIERVRT